ncbi:hypothetical protein FHEFKHOI_01977 [Candidatus Methanoperedenaceae archaeon GB50]|nr:MAG: hypothetical protein KBONHNOK_00039 [Candidatus Methanoperedenaceae archaeon GB50]CAD7776658.1 hypothetical protein FHEFKHOI_01977 [Candidatus Methanoperedenaceae archaeon GB50]
MRVRHSSIRKDSKRLWSFKRSVVKKKTTEIMANTIGLYAINGEKRCRL